VECLAVDFDRFGVNQDERDSARLRAGVDPVVNRAPLNQHVASLEVHEFAVLQLHVDFTRHDDRVINRIGAMYARRVAGVELENSEHRAVRQCRAHLALARIPILGVVDRKVLGRPDDRRIGARPSLLTLQHIVDRDYRSARLIVACDYSTNLHNATQRIAQQSEPDG